MTASGSEVMEARPAARPSSFTQQLQSHIVDLDFMSSNVDDQASDHPQTVNVAESSSSSASRDSQRASLEMDDERCAGNVSVALDARSDDVTLITPTTSPPVAELCRLTLSPSQTQHDPTTVVVVSPLVSAGESAAETKSAVTPRAGVGDDDDAACRRPLSSGWATALAAASIAGKAAASATMKRRPNPTKSGGTSFNIRASRSLFCLTTSNPIRKLCISVVEWKYPLIWLIAIKITDKTIEFCRKNWSICILEIKAFSALYYDTPLTNCRLSKICCNENWDSYL